MPRLALSLPKLASVELGLVKTTAKTMVELPVAVVSGTMLRLPCQTYCPPIRQAQIGATMLVTLVFLAKLTTASMVLHFLLLTPIFNLATSPALLVDSAMTCAQTTTN